MSRILGQNVAEDAQTILAKRTTARMAISRATRRRPAHDGDESGGTIEKHQHQSGNKDDKNDMNVKVISKDNFLDCSRHRSRSRRRRTSLLLLLLKRRRARHNLATMIAKLYPCGRG
ncbi:hypothetical protein PF005_g6945 [Phytophthora fragariae]|uniref:Uncharacterized protein n=1 Tax=Phytophthora fragariae TaxID=53985 RepID=A0A6A3KBP2_9STRA|nr:hypothetical protein PF009_g7717 [Phytophthora fragariae]KAE9004621.1 hypothetical protein PF011_g12379 [Phytophthora fragariae]KAE9123135.1 hypothetical protein PF007_g7163 [Phytophthora fragariae]KAE9149473.1 hypothetical protein PF006_g6047 [Phytophthora fragariae]KAE9221878.1 hypothetical protein PF005_g6945 [Phytophthora fragariae]